MGYNKDQWIYSFESHLSILRPHLTQRVLSAFSGSAWNGSGAKGVDPIEAARAVSEALDKKPDSKPKR